MSESGKLIINEIPKEVNQNTPNEHTNPNNPAEPANPGNPANPINPIDPTNPIEPEPEPDLSASVNYGTTLSWGNSFTPVTLGLFPGNDTTELGLNWYSTGTAAGKEAKVRFIRGTKTAGYEIRESAGTVAAASSGNVSHKAVVTGLKPGHSYQYSVSSDGTNWSPMYDFKIPANTGAFRFAVVSDPQLTTGNVDSKSRFPAASTTTAAGWVQTMNKITAANVSFIASGGDQVDAMAGSETEYTHFFAPSGLRNLPFAPVSGNHDAHLHFTYHFNLPNVQTTSSTFSSTYGSNQDVLKMGNYFYLYNNILFVVLNTAPYPGSTTAASAYITFFRQTLNAAKAAHTGKYDWLIVQHHKSTASVASHVADTDIQYYVEAGFETLMSEFKVDFVLAGHDHVYARSYPLKGMDNGKVSIPIKEGFNPAPGSTWNSPQDPIYLTFTTGSGIKYYQVSVDKTSSYSSSGVASNSKYPYLGSMTGAAGNEATLYGSSNYIAGNLPVSNAAYTQSYIPSYTIVDVDGRTITFKTFPIGSSSKTDAGASQAHSFTEDTAYDTITVKK